MKDVLPPAVSKWRFVEEKVRGVLDSFAFREVRSAATLDRLYLAHARWQHEPLTRWYRLESGEHPRFEVAVFGAGSPSAEAEVIAMTAGLLEDLGVPAPQRALTVRASAETQALLGALRVQFEEAPMATAMSFDARDGAQRLAAGVRNDELVTALGGPPVPALLLEIDLDPLLAAIDEPDESFESPLVALFACDGPAARAWALAAAHRLRLDGVRTDIGHDDAPLDQQRARAASLGARLGIIVREEDLHAGQVLVEDHGTARRELVALGDLESTIRQRVD
jgi:histidyl-tRNA synthetase